MPLNTNPWNTERPLPAEPSAPSGLAQRVTRYSEDEQLAIMIAVSEGKVTRCVRGRARGAKAPRPEDRADYLTTTTIDRAEYARLRAMGFTIDQATAMATR